MRIVGVVDVRGGRAVHAAGGIRTRYATVEEASGLPIDGDPARLASFYRVQCALDDVYMADLDAIRGGAFQADVVRGLVSEDGSLWVDAAITSVPQAEAVVRAGATCLVVGLETLSSYEALEEMAAAAAGDELALSLDLRSGVPLWRPGSPIGGDAIETVVRRCTNAGVRRFIVLDLDRVGRLAGPAFIEIERVRRVAPDAEVYAGGGVRSLHDLQRLQSLGVTGALVATALQQGQLTPDAVHSILMR